MQDGFVTSANSQPQAWRFLTDQRQPLRPTQIIQRRLLPLLYADARVAANKLIDARMIFVLPKGFFCNTY